MISKKLGYAFDLLKEVKKVNELQKQLFVKKVEDELWNIKDKTLAVLGLAFKPHTDDMRFAPSLEIIEALQAHGARVRAFDPEAMEKARRLFEGVTFCKDIYEALRTSDCALILTEWPQFREMDLKRAKKLLHQPLIIDGRNIFDPAAMKAQGFRYVSMGRRAV
jgi:UDPglucose 6-dehydrogenase